MLSLALTRRVVTDWYIDWFINFVCCCCALAFVFFMMAANGRNKIDYLSDERSELCNHFVITMGVNKHSRDH